MVGFEGQLKLRNRTWTTRRWGLGSGGEKSAEVRDVSVLPCMNMFGEGRTECMITGDMQLDG